MLGYLLGHYLNIFIYFVLLNAKASEQSARMVSMKSATDSAESLIKDLTLEYNKLRQGNITRNCWRSPAARRSACPADERETGSMNIGKIVQVVGPVVDVEFPDALPGDLQRPDRRLRGRGQPATLTLEVQQHLGDRWVRTISMAGTEGLKRGLDVTDTGGPITVPVGDGVMGRIFNVTGHPSTSAARSWRRSTTRSTARRRRWSTSRRRRRCSRPASRSST